MPELPLSRRRVLVLAAAVLLALFLADRVLLRAGTPQRIRFDPPVAAASAGPHGGRARRRGRRRRGAAAGPLPAPPGHAHRGCSARAGGATRKADLAQVNLAAPLADGEQVVVPARVVAGASAAVGASGAAPAGPVHLSTATLEQLDALPGVGPVTAQKILDYRAKHGAFCSVDELDAIPGIGPARLDQLRDLVAP